MPPAMLVLQTRPSRLLGGGFSRVLRNSITIKMVLGIVLFFAGMSSLYVNHRLGLSLAGAGLVLVFVPAEFLFGLCIDFKGHKENGRSSRAGSTKSEGQPPEVVIEGDGNYGVAAVSVSGDIASAFPPEVAQEEAGSGSAVVVVAAATPLQDDDSSSTGDSRRTSSPRCTCQSRNSPTDTTVQLHRTRSAVLRGLGSAREAVSELDGARTSEPQLTDGGLSDAAVAAKAEAAPPASAACKFHRTRSAVLRAEDLPKNTSPQIVRFNIGADLDETAASSASARSLPGGSGGRPRGNQSPRQKSGPALVRGVSFEQTTFHRSKSAVMHRGSLSGDEAIASLSPSSSAKSSPTRSLRTVQGQSPNTSPFKERPIAPAVARVQQLQLQQIPALRIQSAKPSIAGADSRVSTMAVQLYEPPAARPPISDLSNENYTRFHRIRAAAQQQQLQQQQAAATSALGAATRKKETPTSQNLLIRTRSMTSSRSSTNLTQPQQDTVSSTAKPSKEKAGSVSQGAKQGSSAADSSRASAAEAIPKLRRTSSGPSKRPARTAKDQAPWTSLAVQTAAGVITLLCKPQGVDAMNLLPKPLQPKGSAREVKVPRLVTVSVCDEDSAADREDSVPSGASGQRDSSSSLAQPSS